MTTFETLRAAMIDSQLRPTGVNDLRVLEAFMPVPREAFVPPAMRALAYLDRAVAIHGGRGLLEPMLFGAMAMRAELGPDDRLLIVGAAAGYEAAVLARLAGEVVALECDAALGVLARDGLEAVGADAVRLVEGPLAAGWPEGAPYDVIWLNGSVDAVPDALTAQLRNGGRLVGVRRGADGAGRAVLGRKGGGVMGLSAFLDVDAAPLPGFARARGFVF